MEDRYVIDFVMTAHGKQLYGNQSPYIVHLMLVARHFTDKKLRTIALLHDVLEDTKVTEFHIKDIFGKEVADAVVALTHKEKEDYLTQYIPRVKENSLARTVKLADLEENLFSINYFYPQYAYLKDKYESALLILKHWTA